MNPSINVTIAHLFLSFLAGILLGSLYFGGLWYTVRRLPTASRPAMLIIGSFLLRLAPFLAAIYLLAAAHWSNLLSAMAGVLLTRTLLIRRWGPDRKPVRNTHGNKS
jgi:F1F0 ATPase subunit 2